LKNAEGKICCFFGHRKISVSDEFTEDLKNVILELITKHSVYTFLFGSRSNFDELCYNIVTEIRESYPCIKRIYVRAEFPYISDTYRNYLLKKYEDTYYPEKILNAGRAVYVERNYEMIDKSDFGVIYYDENYLSGKEKSSRKKVSGTEIAYNYAKRKKLQIINIYKSH